MRTAREVLRLHRGRPKGSKHCDFLEVLRFLNLFRSRAKNIYQIYHSNRRFDLKKVYRYLRYCANIDLIEIDHIAEKGFLPAKYYRLTEKGLALIELFKALRVGRTLE